MEPRDGAPMGFPKGLYLPCDGEGIGTIIISGPDQVRKRGWVPNLGRGPGAAVGCRGHALLGAGATPCCGQGPRPAGGRGHALLGAGATPCWGGPWGKAPQKPRKFYV